MAELIRIRPDADYISRVMGQGGESLKKCFQCATCSVVCTLSPDVRPFPRREMVWAQWGLKDQLLRDPNLWLCHQCTDCSTYCPRGSRPGDVLAALRALTIQEVSFPRFMGRLLARPVFLPLVFIIPAVLLYLTLLVTGKPFYPLGEVEFSKMFSHLTLNLFFPFFTGLAALAFLVGGLRLWRNLSGQPLRLGNLDLGRLILSAVEAIQDILLHRKFKDCGANRLRYFAHLGVLYGFIGLLLTTAVAVGIIVVHLVAPEVAEGSFLLAYPLPLTHPVKIFGNLSAAALLFGCGLMVYNRMTTEDTTMKTGYFDWFFLLVLATVALTGVLAETMRFVDAPEVAYPVYFVHLVTIFALLIYSPYSKFAHFFYRTEAMVYARYAEKGESVAGEAVAVPAS